MSRADDSYDPAEMAAIKNKMNGLFPEGTDLEKKLYVTIREYNSFDKNELAELLSDSIKHFTNNAVEGRLLNDLKEIIAADGKIDQSEINALEALRRMIDHQSKE